MKVLRVALTPFCSPNSIAQESMDRSDDRSIKGIFSTPTGIGPHLRRAGCSGERKQLKLFTRFLCPLGSKSSFVNSLHTRISNVSDAECNTQDFDARSALFSRTNQALKEFLSDRQVAPGFLVRAEYRRDFYESSFFLADTPDALSHSQTTATLGLMSWWGSKQVVGKQFVWGSTCSTL
jgi:hypothetical protein